MNGFRTPRSLVGTRGALGPVPARLRLAPASRARSEQGEKSFDESQALIVICSPSAAVDAQVNHDVDTFVSLGRARAIIPVIAPNAPEADDVEREFFPSALSGRGLFTIDLRERRVADTLVGDGREGGWIKLVAELSGVDVARLAQQEGRKNSARTAALTLMAGVCALAAFAAAAYGVRLQAHIDAIEGQRQHAERNAMRQLQLRREALAAAEQQAAAQASAGQEFDRAKASLLATVRDIGLLADTMLAEITEGRSAGPAAVRTLSALERTYWDVAETSPYFEIRPTAFTSVLERISAAYLQIGHADDAARVDARLARLSQRTSSNRAASPGWRSAYAAAIVAIAQHRGANGDDAGKVSALAQAQRIYEDVCLAPPRQQTAAIADVRAQACLRFAGLVLTRASQQREAEQSIDTGALRRARTVLEAAIAAFPGNTDLQARAPRLRDQIDRILDNANNASGGTVARD